MGKRMAVKDIIEKNWYDTDIITAWNRLCEENNDPDSMVNSMDDFEEFAEGVISRDGIARLLNMIKFGNFDLDNEWWWLNGYGNLHSADDILNCPRCSIDLGEIADYLISEGDAGLAEVDTDELLDAFIGDYFAGDDDAKDAAEEIIREESFDLLTDDWDDLEAAVKVKLAGEEDEDCRI